MRTLLAAAMTLPLIGCMIGDTGTPGSAGDDGTGGNNPGGSNPGGSNPGGSNPTPKVDITLDKSAISTELNTSNPITVTVQGSGDFSGDVALAGTVVDASDVAIPGWTVAFATPTVTLAENGTSTAVATLKVPAKTTGLTGSVKITATSSATMGANVASATVAAMNQVTFTVKVDPATGKCVYPPGIPGSTTTIAQTTKVRFFNTGTANLVIHFQPGAGQGPGVPITHQGQGPNGNADPTTEPNTAYEQMPIGAGTGTWYCHAPDTNLGAQSPRITVQ